MVDRWYSEIELPLSFDEFLKLPTNAAYKYEYFEGKAWLSPRPKSCHGLLALEPRKAIVSLAAQEPIRIRPLEAADWDALEGAFAAAFHRVQPFASLGETERKEAARQCLQFTRDGGDGPLIEPACFVAASQEDEGICGAILVTIMPDKDLSASFDPRWNEPPPPDWQERRLGRPHLTWIFVGPWYTEQGVGSALLAATTGALLALGYSQLASTFLVGNDASALWHWRHGFQLMGRPYSRRRWHALRNDPGQDPATGAPSSPDPGP